MLSGSLHKSVLTAFQRPINQLSLAGDLQSRPPPPPLPQALGCYSNPKAGVVAVNLKKKI